MIMKRLVILVGLLGLLLLGLFWADLLSWPRLTEPVSHPPAGPLEPATPGVAERDSLEGRGRTVVSHADEPKTVQDPLPATADLKGEQVTVRTIVSGMVVDTTGMPVPKATIRVALGESVVIDAIQNVRWRTSPVLATSDAQGWFRVEVTGRFGRKTTKLVRLTSTAAGFPDCERVEIDLEKHTPTQVVKLVLLGAGTIVGRVLDERGTAVAGARLILFDKHEIPVRGAAEVTEFWEDDDEGTIKTDDFGRYRIQNVEEGDYTLEVTARGYEFVRGPGKFTLSKGGAARVTDILVRFTTSLRMRLVDDKRLPLRANIWYELHAADGSLVKQAGERTDRDGVVIITKPPAGSMRLVVGVAGYRKSRPVPVTIVKSRQSDVGTVVLTRDSKGHK
ncbi:MAG: carboxypeptidase regulatory-like domain-containing protein [Planctomycetota bacterium]